jgi:glycosyltransferase involved in cell wall biosynthesis
VVAGQVCDAYPVSADRVFVTHLGVDSAWATVAVPDLVWLTQQGLPDTYLLAVGTLEPRKNLSLLIDVYRLAAQRRLALPPLVLVGATGWGAALDTSGLPDGRVVRTGHLGSEDLRRTVAGAAALVLPSLDEGFGLPPLEALACGIPVVVSDLEVTREVLGDQAAFADARSAEGFLEAIQGALEDPVGTPKSRRAHAARYTWARCALRTRTAYLAALGSR